MSLAPSHRWIQWHRAVRERNVRHAACRCTTTMLPGTTYTPAQRAAALAPHPAVDHSGVYSPERTDVETARWNVARLWGADDTNMAAALCSLGVALKLSRCQWPGDLAEAAMRLRKSLAVLRRVHGAAHATICVT